MLQYERIDVSKRIDKSNKLKDVCFVIVGILKILVSNFNHMHVIDAIIYQ